MIPSKFFEDEIPDSLFRDMLKKNILSLSVMFVFSLFVAIFCYFNFVDFKHEYLTEINLGFEGSVVDADSKLHQKMIRLLKSEEVRAELIEENELIKHYNIDTSDQYYVVKLDKVLYDNLKVEEQFDATIQVKFKDKSMLFAEKNVKDLVAIAIRHLRIYAKEEKIVVNWKLTESSSEETYWKPKLLSSIMLITSPVILFFLLMIAIKEKMLLDIKNEEH